MIPIHSISSTWAPPFEFRNEIVLTYDNWDDFGYKTSFNMYYYDDDRNDIHIGSVKIYNRGRDEDAGSFGRHTRNYIDDEIESLSEDFCSLGQSLEYYNKLKSILPNEYMDILLRLNDIVANKEIRSIYENDSGVLTSLRRFSSAEKAYNEAISIIGDVQQKDKDISFTYRVTAPYDEAPVELSFDFKRSEYMPYRINVLIGKNGTGKTQLLSKLANSLSGYTDEVEKEVFAGYRPPIDKVMSISYSAFDEFKKIPKERSKDGKVFSYVYCGIQSEDGTLSLEQLKEKLERAYETIQEKQREEIWSEILSELMETEHRQTVELIAQKRFNEVRLSSGQQILICTITELIASIENESVILFDEPEIHLHPNAIANVMRMFYKLLDRFNSYAIFSTHSPLILQEIPSQYIQVLNRVDNTLVVRKPEVECLGNNINDIIFDVFDVRSSESNYKEYLSNLSEKLSYEEILHMFNGRLSLNAMIYLKNCYSGRDG